MPESGPRTLTVSACEHAALAMVLLRPARAAEASRALRDRCGLELPLPGRLSAAEGNALLWTGPDRFLAVREAGGLELARELGAILDGLAYVVEASSSRTVLGVSGEWAAELLNRLIPIDLHPRIFIRGSVASTIAWHVPVQIWRPDADAFRLACPSSLAAGFRQQLDRL